MKKSKYILIVIILVIIIGLIIYFYVSSGNSNKSSNEQSNSTNSDAIGTKTSTEANTENDEIQNTQPTETLISTYSTVIKDKSAGRLTNISLTCNIINSTIINPKDTFSFNNIVGKPTSARGYQEAKIIIDHKTETGIGGGNCQVSSTLYNAVLSIPTLTIIERHEHGMDVTYVPDGKDAAVSYGSLDFKFRNDNDYKIKISLLTDNNNITATLFKVDN